MASEHFCHKNDCHVMCEWWVCDSNTPTDKFGVVFGIWDNNNSGWCFASPWTKNKNTDILMTVRKYLLFTQNFQHWVLPSRCCYCRLGVVVGFVIIVFIIVVDEWRWPCRCCCRFTGHCRCCLGWQCHYGRSCRCCLLLFYCHICYCCHCHCLSSNPHMYLLSDYWYSQLCKIQVGR